MKGAGFGQDRPSPVAYLPSTTVPEGLGGILVRTDTRADHMVRDVEQANGGPPCLVRLVTMVFAWPPWRLIGTSVK